MVVQPRVVARTETIERTFLLVQQGGETALNEQDAEGGESVEESSGAAWAIEEEQRWWAPLTQIVFDDPEQEPPRLPTSEPCAHADADAWRVGDGVSGQEPPYLWRFPRWQESG